MQRFTFEWGFKKFVMSTKQTFALARFSVGIILSASPGTMLPMPYSNTLQISGGFLKDSLVPWNEPTGSHFQVLPSTPDGRKVSLFLTVPAGAMYLASQGVSGCQTGSAALFYCPEQMPSMSSPSLRPYSCSIHLREPFA